MLLPRTVLLVSAVATTVAPATAQRGARGASLALFFGSVVAPDSALTAIPDVELRIEELKRTTRTDSLGNFSFDALPAGEFTLVVRHWGFVSLTGPITVRSGDTLIHTIRLSPIVALLEAVKVKDTAPPNDPRMADMEWRRKLGIGHFIDRATLDKETPGRPLGEVLAQVPGVAMVRMSMNIDVAFSSRSTPTTGRLGSGGGRCPMAVWMDGIRLFPPPPARSPPYFDLDQILVDLIGAIEIYAGESEVPLQFGSTRGACGAIVIWTRVE